MTKVLKLRMMLKYTNMRKERFIKRPNDSHLESIFSWCPYYEKSRILNHKNSKDGGVLVMVNVKTAIAYLYYRQLTENIVEIDFIEVNRDYKRKGVATRLMKQAFQFFMAKGLKIVDINCVTKAGYRHARKLGFKKYVQENWSYNSSYEVDCRMFYTLCPSTRLRKYRKSMKMKFVIWTKDPSGRGTPDLYYDISKEDILPLADYIHYDWFVGIMKVEDILRQDKAKRFFKDDYHDINWDCTVYLTSSLILETLK